MSCEVLVFHAQIKCAHGNLQPCKVETEKKEPMFAFMRDVMQSALSESVETQRVHMCTTGPRQG